jgi:hypothetical protein
MHVHSNPVAFNFAQVPQARSVSSNTSSTSALDSSITALADVFAPLVTSSSARNRYVANEPKPRETATSSSEPEAPDDSTGQSPVSSKQYNSGASFASTEPTLGTLIDILA